MIPQEDVVDVGGVRVTAVPLTVVEAAVELGTHGSRLLDRALQRFTWHDLINRPDAVIAEIRATLARQQAG